MSEEADLQSAEPTRLLNTPNFPLQWFLRLTVFITAVPELFCAGNNNLGQPFGMSDDLTCPSNQPCQAWAFGVFLLCVFLS